MREKKEIEAWIEKIQMLRKNENSVIIDGFMEGYEWALKWAIRNDGLNPEQQINLWSDTSFL